MENTTLETAPPAICNQSQGPNAKRRKRTWKRKKSIAGSNCEAGHFSSQEKSHDGGDVSLSAASDMCFQAVAEVSQPQKKEIDNVRSSYPNREAVEGILSDHSNVVSQNIETAPSTICGPSKAQNAKNRRKRKKSKVTHDSITNADTNRDPNGISSQARSFSGMDMSLSSIVSRENDKSESYHPDREAANGTASDHSNNVVHENIEIVPSAISEQSKEHNAKKGKKRKKKSKKVNDSISHADNNGNPDGLSSQTRSCFGGDLSLSLVGGTHIQADTEAANGIVSDQCNNVVSQNIETAPSTISDQSKEHKAKKRKKRKKKSKKINDSISHADNNRNPDGLSSQTRSCFGGDLSLLSIGGTHIQADTEAANGIVSDQCNNVVSQIIETAPSTICDQSKEHKAKKRKKRKKKSKKINDSIPHADNNCDPGGISSNGEVAFRCSSFMDQSQLSSSELGNVKAAGRSCRKLLILDLNGLLADIRSKNVEGFEPDKRIRKKSVYKRPFCDDFLQFCFENFDVAVWSSRKRRNVRLMLGFLMKADVREKLVFRWNQSHCTRTRRKTLEDKHKPIFLKELKKLWGKVMQLPQGSEKVVYDESNTLLIDDSPYKALRNPPYTAIFPIPYVCNDTEDNSLGPEGELRLYLKRLAEAENVQEFVKENPIGQNEITPSHPDWSYYSIIAHPPPPNSGQQQQTVSNPVPVPMNLEN